MPNFMSGSSRLGSRSHTARRPLPPAFPPRITDPQPVQFGDLQETGTRTMGRRGLGRLLAAALLGMATIAAPAMAQEKKIKIGVVYDLTGPFAGGGSDLHYLGAKIVIDYINEHGGIEGYKIDPVYADAQSKPDIAINEAVRLIEQEKVDMLLGFYASAGCVPAAARIEQFKKFMWITTCIAAPV